MVGKKSPNKLDKGAVTSSSKITKISSDLVMLFLKDGKINKKNLAIFLGLFILVSIGAVTIPSFFVKKVESTSKEYVEYVEPEKTVIKPKSNWLKYTIKQNGGKFFSENFIKLGILSKDFIAKIKKVDSVFLKNHIYKEGSSTVLSEDYEEINIILTNIYDKLIKIDQRSMYLIDKAISDGYVFEASQIFQIIGELESINTDLDKFLDHSKIFIYEKRGFPDRVIPLLNDLDKYLISTINVSSGITGNPFTIVKGRIDAVISNYKNIDGYVLDETKIMGDIDYLIQYIETLKIPDNRKKEIIGKLNEFRAEFSKISQIKDDSFDLKGVGKKIIEKLDDIIYKISI